MVRKKRRRRRIASLAMRLSLFVGFFLDCWILSKAPESIRSTQQWCKMWDIRTEDLEVNIGQEKKNNSHPIQFESFIDWHNSVSGERNQIISL